jgi:hypothetical protein
MARILERRHGKKSRFDVEKLKHYWRIMDKKTGERIYYASFTETQTTAGSTRGAACDEDDGSELLEECSFWRKLPWYN